MFYINLREHFLVRYDSAKFMGYSNGCYDLLTSYFRKKIKDLPLGGYYNVVAEEGKPDLISYNIYGKTEFWWILLIYNSVIDPDDIVAGMTLNYPNISDLENLFFSLHLEERKR